jgi:hypothetical protein
MRIIFPVEFLASSRFELPIAGKKRLLLRDAGTAADYGGYSNDNSGFSKLHVSIMAQAG